MNEKNILVTGGGTGGHLMPAIAICEILSMNGYKTTLITDSRCINYLPTSLNFDVKIFDLLRPNSFKNLFKFFVSFEKIFRTSYRMCKVKDIKLIVACGGYSSVPIILAAFFARVKIVLHEQNSVVGRANYWLSYISDKLFLSFMHTVHIPLISQKKLIWSGIPSLMKHQSATKNEYLHKNKEDARLVDSQSNLNHSRKITILVTGGSQGAEVFDKLIPACIKLLVGKYPNIKFIIIQQVRSKNLELIENEYREIGVNCKVENFFHDLEQYYKKADLFIGRSGASTINELIRYKLPPILIPYPHAKDNHQYYNAKNLVEFQAGWLIEQKNISEELLYKKIATIIESDSKLLLAKKQLTKLEIDTPKIITDEIKKIIDK